MIIIADTVETAYIGTVRFEHRHPLYAISSVIDDAIFHYSSRLGLENISVMDDISYKQIDYKLSYVIGIINPPTPEDI